VRAHPVTVPRSNVRRTAAFALIACIAATLAACTATGESSSEQLPIGPKPSVTVLLRVGGEAGTTVELLGTGTTQGALDVAAGAVATAAFPSAQVGPPQQATDSDPQLTVATVPVQLPTDAMTFELDSGAIAGAMTPVHPKALSVWVCTDDRRSLSVDSTAPGAVSSDIVHGQCQVAGSTLAHDDVTWMADVSVGAVEPQSKLPWLIGGAVLIALIAGAVWLLRGRRDNQQEPVIGPPLPPAPPVH
jgi:hypothetical protein